MKNKKKTKRKKLRHKNRKPKSNLLLDVVKVFSVECGTLMTEYF